MHRVLMLLYPRAFRRAWHEEVERVRGGVLAEARDRGVVALLRAHVWLVWDALRALPGAWRDALVDERAPMASTAPGDRVSAAIDTLRLDVRHTLRLWRHAPGFTACALATLGLGMGAAVAIFSVVYAVLLRPLEYRAPDEVSIATGLFYPDFDRFRASPAVAGITPWRTWRAGLRESDGSVGVRHSAAVGATYFDLLGVKPAVGRFIGSVDSAAGEWNSIVMSWGTWQKEFAGRRDIVGTRLSIDTTTYTVVGVAPRWFTDPLGFYINDIETAFFRLLRPAERRGPAQAVIRLRPPATPAIAQKQLDPLVELPPPPPEAALPASATRANLTVTGAFDARTTQARPTLYVLSAAVALLLLIGCANTANLLLTRSTTRHAELMLRSALGASRARLVAQLMTESLMLAAAAAFLGTWIGYIGSRALVAFAGTAIPRASEVALHPAVLAFAAAIAVLTAIASGLMPALRDSVAALAATTREHGRGVIGVRAGKRIRSLLVVAQVALAVVLASGAGMLVRSLWRLEAVDPGFDAEPVLTVRVTFPPNRMSATERLQRQQEIIAALERQPDVRGAAAVNVHPLTGAGINLPITRVGQQVSPDGHDAALLRPVLSDYFGTMGIALLAGAPLPRVTQPGSDPVTVISRTLAQRLFGNEGALERTVVIADQNYRVVGVVEDVREFALDAEVPGTAYVSYAQAPAGTLGTTVTFLIRAAGNGRTLIPAVRAAIRSVDPDLPVAFWRTMRDMMDENLLAPRLRAILLGTFGTLAALLAIIGLSGAMAYTVAQAIPEIGVRLALGATGSQVSGLVLREALALVFGGLLIGTGAALLGSRLLRTLVFQIAPNDPLVLSLVAGATLVVAMVATWYPAHRAASVDPATVLRAQ